MHVDQCTDEPPSVVQKRRYMPPLRVETTNIASLRSATHIYSGGRRNFGYSAPVFFFSSSMETVSSKLKKLVNSLDAAAVASVYKLKSHLIRRVGSPSTPIRSSFKPSFIVTEYP